MTLDISKLIGKAKEIFANGTGEDLFSQFPMIIYRGDNPEYMGEIEFEIEDGNLIIYERKTKEEKLLDKLKE